MRDGIDASVLSRGGSVRAILSLCASPRSWSMARMILLMCGGGTPFEASASHISPSSVALKFTKSSTSSYPRVIKVSSYRLSLTPSRNA
eukprot:1905347-Prymnesium_polylepis.2